MSDIATIRAEHARCTPRVCDLWATPKKGPPVTCPTRLVLDALDAAEAERDAAESDLRQLAEAIDAIEEAIARHRSRQFVRERTGGERTS